MVYISVCTAVHDRVWVYIPSYTVLCGALGSRELGCRKIFSFVRLTERKECRYTDPTASFPPYTAHMRKLSFHITV